MGWSGIVVGLMLAGGLVEVLGLFLGAFSTGLVIIAIGAAIIALNIRGLSKASNQGFPGLLLGCGAFMAVGVFVVYLHFANPSLAKEFEHNPTPQHNTKAKG